MWNNEPKDKTFIRYLCPQCLDAYNATGVYIIRCLGPFRKTKDTCDCCIHLGWDYVVV